MGKVTSVSKRTTVAGKTAGSTSVRKVVATRKTSGRKTGTKKIVQRVLPLGNGWVVKSDRSKKFTVVTISKKEAIEIAKSIAKNQHSELVIHTKEGKIKETLSFAITGAAKKRK